jgi:hypothetical protein
MREGNSVTQAAILRLAYLASSHQLTQEEICRALRESRQAQGAGEITVPTVERSVRMTVAARASRAAA